MNLEKVSLIRYNIPMSKTVESPYKVDLGALCRDLESATEQSAAQIAERLDFNIKSYYHWRNGVREPNGQDTAKLFLYLRKIENEKNIKIPLKFKE